MSEYKFVGPYEQIYLFPGHTVVAIPGDVYSLDITPPIDGHWEQVPDSTPVTPIVIPTPNESQETD